MHRRDLLRTGLAAGAATLLAPLSCAEGAAPSKAGALRQSVSRWCFSGMSVDALARAAKEIGLASVELLDPEDWPAVQAHGLTCAMANAPRPPRDLSGGAGYIEWGWNRVAHHDWLVQAYEERLQQVAEAGLPRLICFSGNRAGLSDAEGLANCARGLQRITPLAERLGVTLCMELLNSKVDHADYQADHTRWGAELVDAVGSERFRLLYDIYHMQIMEGDVIRTIREFSPYIAHYHTAGVPGRNEIDDSQELYYPAICRAIAETGFTGFVGQEFVPTRDPLTSLREAVEICTV